MKLPTAALRSGASRLCAPAPVLSHALSLVRLAVRANLGRPPCSRCLPVAGAHRVWPTAHGLRRFSCGPQSVEECAEVRRGDDEPLAKRIEKRCHQLIALQPMTAREREMMQSRSRSRQEDASSRLTPEVEAEARNVLDEFHRARAAGLGVCSGRVLSAVIRVSCMPGTPWAASEIPRALRLFESSHFACSGAQMDIGSAQSEPFPGIDPSGNHWDTNASGRPPHGRMPLFVRRRLPEEEEHALLSVVQEVRKAVMLKDVHIAQETQSRSVIDDRWESAITSVRGAKRQEKNQLDAMSCRSTPLVEWQSIPECTAEGCTNVPVFGSPVDGRPLACHAHRTPLHVYVEPSRPALRSLAGSLSKHPRLFRSAGRIIGYLLERQPLGIGELVLLTQLYASCSSAEFITANDVRLVEWVLLDVLARGKGHDDGHVVGNIDKSMGFKAKIAVAPRTSETRELRRHRACVNAALHALGSRGAPAAALTLHTASLAVGLQSNDSTFLALLRACARAGSYTSALNIALAAEHEGSFLVRDPRHVATLLSACARAGDASGARKLFDTCMEAGLKPDRQVFVALSHALGTGGMVDEAVDAYYTGARVTGSQPDTDPVAVSVVIGACAKARDPDRALRIFSELRADSPARRSPGPYAALLRSFAVASSPLKPMEDRAEWAMALARDSGVPLSASMLNALLVTYSRSSDALAAIAAYRRWVHPPLRPNRGTILTLLGACTRDRRPELTPTVEEIAKEQGLRLGGAARNLVLLANIMAIDGSPKHVEQDNAKLDELLRQYDSGERMGIRWTLATRRILLHVCAVCNRVEEATRLFEQMSARGEQPGFEAESALMEAYYRSGEVDKDVMVLWRRGRRLSGQRASPMSTVDREIANDDTGRSSRRPQPGEADDEMTF